MVLLVDGIDGLAGIRLLPFRDPNKNPPPTPFKRGRQGDSDHPRSRMRRRTEAYCKVRRREAPRRGTREMSAFSRRPPTYMGSQ
jgi:hypothetical protein